MTTPLDVKQIIAVGQRTHIEQPTTLVLDDAVISNRLLMATALSEGSSGFWDDCGPDANCMVGRINHLLPDSLYNGATIANIRQRDIDAGRFQPGGGQDLDNIKWDIETHSHNQHVLLYSPYQQPGDWETMHGWLKLYAGVHAILIQVLEAHNLPNNEPGVYSHFLCVSGLDSIKGYFLLNGDEVDANGHNYLGKYTGTWATVDQIIPANVAGMIVVARNAGAPYVP